VIENGPIYLDRAMPQQFAEAVLNFLDSKTQIKAVR
jgi:hypothetical protein